MNFFRWIAIYLCCPLYQLIPLLYRLFYDLANATFFNQDVIQTFSKNIYVLLSVVMLFAFAVKALESIINPDLLFDSKKGFTGVLKRSIIALVLIIIIPFAFDKFYEYQEQIMSKSLIEKIILGANIEGTSDQNTAEKTGAGQMLAGLTLSSVLYIDDDTTVYEDMQDTIDAYDSAIGDDIDNMINIAPGINEKTDDGDNETYIFEFHWLEAIVIGIIEIYLLALFCLDTAERVIRLGFLQLTAPISVIAYVYGGNDILKNWGSETFKTAFSVFIRIAALAFLIFVLANITSFMENYEGFYGKLICLLIIVGALMFIKEAPKTIEKIFGFSIGGKSGVKGRLGNMFGADVAKKALTATALGGAALAGGAAALVGAAAKGIDNKAFNGAGQSKINGLKNAGTKLSNSKFGQNVGRITRAASAGMQAGGVKNAVSAANKSFKDDKLTKYNSEVKAAEADARQSNSVGLDALGRLISNSSTAARDAVNAHTEAVNSDGRLNSNVKNAIIDNQNANLKKGTLEKFQSNKNDALTGLKKLSDNARTAGDIRTADMLTNLANDFSDGKIDTATLKNKVDDMKVNGKINSTDASGVIKKLDNMDHIVQNDISGAVSSLTTDGSVSDAALSGAIKDISKEVESTEATLNREKSIASESTQHVIDNYINDGKSINDQYTREISKDGAAFTSSFVGPSISQSDRQSISQVSQPSGVSQQVDIQQGSPIQNQQTVSSNSTTDIPSGYTQTDSGIVIPQGSSGTQSPTSNNSQTYGGHTDHTSAQDDAYRNINSSDNANNSNQNVDLSGVEGMMQNVRDDINSNINNNTSELRNDIGSTRDDINRNLQNVSDNINSNITRTTNDVADNIRRQSSDINQSLNDFFSNNNNGDNE